jgi:hypothetical protein
MIRWWSLGSAWWERLSRSLTPIQCTKLIYVPPWEGFSPNSARLSIISSILGHDKHGRSEVYCYYFPSLILYCIRHFYCVILHLMSPVSFISSWTTVFVQFHLCIGVTVWMAACESCLHQASLPSVRFWVPGVVCTCLAGAPRPGPHPNMPVWQAFFVAAAAAAATTAFHTMDVFRCVKRCKKSTVARFCFIWQIVSNR